MTTLTNSIIRLKSTTVGNSLQRKQNKRRKHNFKKSLRTLSEILTSSKTICQNVDYGVITKSSGDKSTQQPIGNQMEKANLLCDAQLIVI